MVVAYAVDNARMTWVRTEVGVGQERYELRTDNAVIGVLCRSGSLIVSGEAESDCGHWVFAPDGLLHRSIAISDVPSGALLAVYERQCTQSAIRGVMRFSDGRRLEWLKERTWAESWAFATEQGEPIVRFRDGLEQGTIAEPAGSVVAGPELSLLLMLGFYLRCLSVEEDRLAAKREERRRR